MSPLSRVDLPSRMLAASLAVAFATLLALGGCAPTRNGQKFAGIGSIFATDLSARHPRGAGGVSPGSPQYSGNVATLGTQERVYHGAGAGQANSQQGVASTFEPNEFNLNFQNADIREVVQAVLGNALGVNYTIDPSVGGAVTLSSARPIGRDELVPALEVVLQTVGAVLVRSGGVYRVALEPTASASGADFARSGQGYGISIIPLEYVSAKTLIGLVEGFGVRPGTLRAEARNNLLIVMGSSVDRQAAMETALSFDVDWMENQSVAVLPLRHAKPETIIPELERIFASRQSEVGADLVQFLPMQRLKAVLVVSPRRSSLDAARTWVQRLDSANPDLEADVFVYRVKYRDAQKIAELLSSIFGGGGGGFTPDTPTDQIAPGAEGIAQVLNAQSPDLIAGGAAGSAAPIGGPVENGGSGANVRIQADVANNSVVIFADLETRRQIIAALNRIDVPQLQVAINVTMAEIRLNDQLRHGVQYFIRSNAAGLGKDKGSAGLFSTLANNIGRDLPGFNFVLGSETSPEIIISAFQGLTDVQVLSSPSLVVVENETARFQVGDQIPIVTRTVTSVENNQAPISNEIEYRDTGIILQIKPRISENGVVNLDIAQEISSVAAGSATLTPTISNRTIESTISVVDGQTVLLGGLIGEQTEDSNGGVPGLSRLPVLGNAFRNRARSGSRTELIILIRPSVIRGGEDAQYVAEELRSRMWRARQAN